MSDLLIALIHPHVGLVPMQTIAEWLRAQFADAKTVLVSFASLAVLALAVARLIKSGFSIGGLIVVACVAALALWLIAGGGIQDISDLVSEQSKGK